MTASLAQQVQQFRMLRQIDRANRAPTILDRLSPQIGTALQLLNQGSFRMGHALEFTDAGFQSDVLDSEVTVLVDFWAPWCGPCRQIAPLIEELAKNYEGTAKVGKVNVDENPGVAQQYGINSIPTLLVFKEGKVTERFVGMPPRSKLEAAMS